MAAWSTYSCFSANGGLTITDFGESLGWLRLQSVSKRRSPKQNRMIGDVCQTLGLELERGQLVLRVSADAAVGDSVLRVAQAAVRVSDLWFTLRTRAAQSASEEVHEWLTERFHREIEREYEALRL